MPIPPETLSRLLVLEATVAALVRELPAETRMRIADAVADLAIGVPADDPAPLAQCVRRMLGRLADPHG